VLSGTDVYLFIYLFPDKSFITAITYTRVLSVNCYWHPIRNTGNR